MTRTRSSYRDIGAALPRCEKCRRPLNPAAVLVYGRRGPCGPCLRHQHADLVARIGAYGRNGR